ncbi:hypothetical protein TWF696_002754 [Orbilia brochopaga]|uniref:Uncharacterized protein n=1 Tax=Orbilia brochopaga TaxID=3140254 RepID=A0AAV9U0Q8_9PEZI
MRPIQVLKAREGIPKQQQQAITGILRMLVQRGYLVVSGAGKLVSKRAPNKYKLVQTDKVLRRLEEDILDPLANINRHYKLAKGSLRIADQGVESSQQQEPRQLGFVARSIGEAVPEGTVQEGYGQSDQHLGVQTPISQLRTSDALSHLKAGDWT